MREIACVDGRPKVVSQIYLCSPDKVAGLLAQRDEDTIERKVAEFGALWLAAQVDQDIDLSAIVDQVIPRAEREAGSGSARMMSTPARYTPLDGQHKSAATCSHAWWPWPICGGSN